MKGHPAAVSALLCMIVLLCSFTKKRPGAVPFKFSHFTNLKHIPEPSDIVYDNASGHFYIVSDHGMLFECDAAGKILREAEDGGYDFEGVEIKDSLIYVSDEMPRKVYIYRKSDLSLVKVIDVSWGGALNKAYESIIYNPVRHCFILIAEQPATIVEYDEQFKELAKYSFNKARDINGARWYDGSIYLVSSLDETIFKCDPQTYEVQERYKINVLNPEGLAFDDSGKVLVTSDDLGRLYFFNSLPKTK